MIGRHVIIHTDGGARGNPGPAAIGAVLESDGRTLETISRTIGETTNNQAEYQAVHAALTAALAHGATHVDLYADSELVVKQLRGEYKIKHQDLGPWAVRIHSLVNQIGRVSFHAISRDQNSRADALVNQALDQAAAIT